jgi:serine protease Do
MRQHWVRCMLCGVVLLAMAWLPSSRAVADAPVTNLSEMITPLLRAVVAIQTIATTPKGTMYFDGSGFIIDPSGLILTNRHVIVGAYDITANMPGIGELKAKPLFISDGIDLALLKVDAGQPLPTLKLGDSDKLHIGDPVILVGNPLGVGESLSFGVVSALNRDLGDTMYDDFIQTDAALNHGNSGGAMLNIAGEVVGMNTALISSPGNTGSIGIGYSIPINDAKFVIDQFLRTGEVIVGTLGVQAQRMTDDLATAFGVGSARGVIVTGVIENGPAAGKIQPGDIILKVGTLDASEMRAAARLVTTTPPGQALDVTLQRNGAEQTVTLTVGKMESNPKAGLALLGHAPNQAHLCATPSDPGMELAAIDEGLRRKFALQPDQHGVVVTDVNSKGVAATRKIVVGDVIVSVDGKLVSNPADVQQHLREVSDRHVPFAALLVAGEQSTRWVALPLEADH